MALARAPTAHTALACGRADRIAASLRTRRPAARVARALRPCAVPLQRRGCCVRRRAAHVAPCTASAGAVLPLLFKPVLDALPVPPALLAACVLCGAALAAALAAARAAREPRPRIVVVGGGFAGLQAALELQHWAREVTLVDRASYFEYTPGVLQALASGDVQPCHRPHSRSLTRAKLLRVPHTATMRVGDHELELSAEYAGPAALQNGNKAKVSLGSVTTRTLPFDYLILATGSSYPTPIKPTGDEQDAVQRASDLARSTAELAAARDVLIIGGGIVGVELAAEIAVRQKHVRVTVADVAPRLLATLPSVAGERAAATLKAAGVRLLLGGPLTRAEGGIAGRSAYTTPSRETVEADVVYLCVGARPNSACLQSSVPLDARGYVRVDERWRVAGRSDVYAIGDLAAKPPAQQLGSYAHWEAEFVARDIRRAMAGRPPARYVAPPQLVNVSLGPSDGLFLYDGVLLLSGLLSALLKRATQLWFVALLPIPYALLRYLPRVGAAPAPPPQQPLLAV